MYLRQLEMEGRVEEVRAGEGFQHAQGWMVRGGGSLGQGRISGRCKVGRCVQGTRQCGQLYEPGEEGRLGEMRAAGGIRRAGAKERGKCEN